MQYVKPLPDHEIRAALVAAHRSRTLMPGGSLETSIASLRRELAATLRDLADWTSRGNRFAAALGWSSLEAVRPELAASPRATLEAAYGYALCCRVALAKDIARQRRHLAELEEALREVAMEDAARDIAGGLHRGGDAVIGALTGFVRGLARAFGAEPPV
jgi:hypothetical protein